MKKPSATKILSLALSLLLLCGILAPATMAANWTPPTFSGLVTDFRSDEPLLSSQAIVGDFLVDGDVLVSYIGASGASVNIPNNLGVTKIGSYAFMEKSITCVVIPEGITEIRQGAFSNNALTTVVLPSSLRVIVGNPFFHNRDLMEFQISAGNSYFSVEGGVLFNKDKTTLIAYPPAKTGTAYSVPSSVTTIGDNAFYNSTLSKLTIPPSVTSIAWSILDYWDIYDSDLTFVGLPGSAAEEYAINRGIPFLPYGLCVETLPTKVIYALGETFDNTGMVIRMHNGDGTSQVVTGSITGYDRNRKGAQTVTVTYQDHTASLTVWVGLVLVPGPYPESSHPYTDNLAYSFTSEKVWGALSLTLVFSDDTRTEAYYDTITLSKGDGTPIGTYSGKELAGKAITIPGNTYQIKLDTDSWGTDYGFRLVRILADMDTNLITATIPDSWEFPYPIVVEFGPDAQLDGVILDVEKIDDSKKYEVLGFDSDTPIFDINLIRVSDGKIVQPAATVIVRIPDPFLDDVTPQIFRVSDDGKTRENVNAKRVIYEGKRYLEFETDHFSYYALVTAGNIVKITASAAKIEYYNGTVQLSASGGNGSYTWILDSNAFATLDAAAGDTVTAKPVKNFWKLGSVTIIAEDGNGTQSEPLTLQIRPTFWQWLLIVLLFGWIWM